jgi:nitrate reductase gamma subunit
MSIFTPSDASPQNFLEVVLAPWLFAFFGLMIGFGAVRQLQQTGKLPSWWKLSFLPSVLGLFLGFQRFMYLQDTLYQSSIQSRKHIFMHYLAPIGVIISIAVVLLMIKRQNVAESKKVY